MDEPMIESGLNGVYFLFNFFLKKRYNSSYGRPKLKLVDKLMHQKEAESWKPIEQSLFLHLDHFYTIYAVSLFFYVS